MRDATILIGHVHELIAALDRRRPQPNRSDEPAIARQAAALRARALARLAELERVAGRRGGSRSARGRRSPGRAPASRDAARG
jgi:hypothetical protein